MITIEQRKEINNRLARLNIGEPMIYFTGELARERALPGTVELNQIANCAMELAARGLVQLTQRRLKPNIFGIAQYDYIATGCMPALAAMKRAA